MLLAVCTDPNLLQAVLLTKKIILILEIAAPLAVIIYAGLDIIKAVTSKNQESIKKATDMIPRRLVAMAIVFFVPLLIDMTMQIADNEFEYTACFKNATNEKIQSLFVDIANEKIAKVSEEMNKQDWKSDDALFALEDAKNAILKIVDEPTRKLYDNKVTDLNATIKQKKEQEQKDALEKTELKLREGAYAPPDGGFNLGGSVPGGGSGDGGGVLPYYSQCDKRWNDGSHKYYGNSYCRTACGATSLAMVAAGLSGNSSVTPVTVYERMKALGLPPTYSQHTSFTSSALLGTWGIKGTAIGTGSNKSATKAAFDKALGANKPIIANVPGHYIVVDHMKDGKYHVLDPARPRFNRYFTWDEFWRDVIINYIGRNSPRYAYFYYEKV